MNRGRIGQGQLGRTIERCQNKLTAELHPYSDTKRTHGATIEDSKAFTALLPRLCSGYDNNYEIVQTPGLAAIVQVAAK